MANIFQQQITPEKPKVLGEERIYVYIPVAGNNTKGIAAFNSRDFQVNKEGQVSLRWPMEMMVESLANPIDRPSLIKVLGDEFLQTNNIITITNPITQATYSTNSAELKLNRENRMAFNRPDLVMLDSNDFEEFKVIGNNNEQYNSYRLKRKDPFEAAAIVKLDKQEFKQDSDGTISINWPYAHDMTIGTFKTNGYGLVRVGDRETSNLEFDTNGDLQVSIDTLKENTAFTTKIVYGETNQSYWPELPDFVDEETGVAKRNDYGATLISITKESVGLSNVENIAFRDRVYGMFGPAMKGHFDNSFNAKLDKTDWNNVFSDWAPPSPDRSTAQKWFRYLESKDRAIMSSINSKNLFIGFYQTANELIKLNPPSALLFNSYAYVNETSTHWSVKPIDATRYYAMFRGNQTLASISGQTENDRVVDLDTGMEYIWKDNKWSTEGVHNEAWQWYNTNSSINFLDYIETNADNLQPNSPIGSVSAGMSGKWAQSDHVHPSDSTKLDADLLETATVTINTIAPGDNDFKLNLATTKVYNQDGEEINAKIVSTPQYLDGISNPQTDDLAIARNTGQIFVYSGLDWLYTGSKGSITCNTNSSVNIPYVRTGQYIHNWKNSPTMFVQDANSNESYWAGTRKEFDSLNYDDMPINSSFHVEDGEDLLDADDIVTKPILEATGVSLESDDRFVTVNATKETIYRRPLTANIVTTTSGIKRYQLAPYGFSNLAARDQNTRLAVISPDANGYLQIYRTAFTPNSLIVSDDYGNLQASSIEADNIVKSTSTIVANQLIVGSYGSNVIKSFSTGTTKLLPIVTNGVGGIEVCSLSANKFIVTNSNGGLTTINTRPDNILRTSDEATQNIIVENKVLISGGNNTVKPFTTINSSEGTLIVRGTNDGEITTKTWNANNRLLYTTVNGTIGELAAGVKGQYLVSNGDGVPSWADVPIDKTSLPQTYLTKNPTESEANSFKGLVAILLDSAPEVTELRNNCIYYY